jgi:glycosyltransferase involved in cell wall biosynthesis
VRNIDVSVIVPTMNEEITAPQFISWCLEGFSKLNLTGEIIFLDSSTDKTPEIARDSGVMVVEVTDRGLGNAYRAGKAFPTGRYVILGDADCTYDFRNIAPFIHKLNEGFDLVLGNRFKGSIEKGAMPIHHQYFGSPGTSLFFRYALGIPTSDIHCGMRAMTLNLYKSLPFIESGWEYATEMIVSARNLEAKITEIPIEFFKEPEGRLSHHKRSSWLSPFRAGWGTLRVTVTYLVDRLFVIPGGLILVGSSVLNLVTTFFQAKILESFRIGLLGQSILMFISSIGAFMFTTGLLARFAYRRKLASLSFIARSKFSSRLFSSLIAATFVEAALSLSVLFSWISTLKLDPSEFTYDSNLISSWLGFTSFYLCVLSLAIASLIGNHAQKLQR